jgi:aminopeptidase-like protein
MEELRQHIHTLPAQPDWIPHRTGFYAETWGFAMAHRTLLAMKEPAYRVSIDTTTADGHLTYGEFVLPGSDTEEFLISAHCCHPSLANDNLSGLVVATRLAQRLRALPYRRLTYRFLFAPTTIGSLTWLARNEATLSSIRHGLVLTCLGDGGSFHYKRSRRENAEIDRFAEHALRHAGDAFTMLPFEPYGYDERQYCSPAFDLPVGCFMRTPNDRYAEYHTSADDLDLIDPEALVGSLDRLWDIVGIAEGNAVYQSRFPRGEPQLGRRGLYRPISRGSSNSDSQLTLLWVLNLADGKHSLLDVAERAGRRFDEVRAAADVLVESGLIERLDGC